MPHDQFITLKELVAVRRDIFAKQAIVITRYSGNRNDVILILRIIRHCDRSK